MKRTTECHPDKAHYSLGLCKQCYEKAKYRGDHTHRRKRIIAASKYNSSRSSAYRRYKHLKACYGLLPEEVDFISKQLNNCCEICHKQVETLHIDHNHVTNEFRGMLCGSCNCALGLFQDSPTVIQSALSYLDFNH